MRHFALSLLVMVSTAATVFAQDSGTGVGLSTDGLAGKYWLNGTNAVSFHWNFGTTVAADYLFDNPELVKIVDNPTPVYYGVGALIGTHEGINDNLETVTKIDLGVRGVIGISYYLSSYPVDIYIESVPTLKLLGGGGLNFGGSLGIRYFF